jgi:hypothetical protein
VDIQFSFLECMHRRGIGILPILHRLEADATIAATFKE